jgi:hypothetical protein
VDSFQGRHRNYQAIDAGYHDLEHTLQGDIVHGAVAFPVSFREQPVLTQRMFELGLLAILLHDTGYLKQHGDDGARGPNIPWSMSTAAQISRGAPGG